jgi:hypothetical protein
LQGFEVQDHETLQSQIGKIAENRLPLSGLQIFHGRLGQKQTSDRRTLMSALPPKADSCSAGKFSLSSASTKTDQQNDLLGR